MSKYQKKEKNESLSTGKVDEADVTQEVPGQKSAAFGLAIDSEGRSTPTHMLPFHVRQTLSRWWSNVPGAPEILASDSAYSQVTNTFRVGTNDAGTNIFEDAYLSWYEPSDQIGETGPGPDTVAARMAVTVNDAEAVVNGNPTADNAFLNYADVPMNQGALDRLAFWAYNQDAIELDPNYQFEAQLEAVDAFSQIFTESFDFHFQFLATLDSEYHRLRPAGPLGVLDGDSSEDSAWHNMYHYFRAEVERAYLDSGLITLPAGLRNSTWTIADVLSEILRLCLDAQGNLLSDIKLSMKGLIRAKSGITLGIYNDANMTDSDGNVRFYMPAWRTSTAPGETSATTPEVLEDTNNVSFPVYEIINDNPELSDIVYGTSPTTDPSDTSVISGISTAYHDAQAATMAPTLEVLAANGRLPLWIRENENDASVISTSVTASLLTMIHSRPESYFQSLPGPSGLLSGSFAYWRGYNLNLVELIAVARRMGRVLEPEVCEGFMPAMGMVNGIEPLLSQPQGLNARGYDDLINAYTSSFSYNENPARVYTAAHLGPLDRGVARGELMVGDHVLHTEQTDANGNTTALSVRDRYWTPSSIVDADEKARILQYFLPGGTLENPLAGDLDLTNASAFVDQLDAALIGRLFGDTASMLTKVERPVVLPAGVATPDDTFASGIGIGAIQLMVELQACVFGGKPFIALGHNGFTDWHPRTDGTPRSRGEAVLSDESSYILMVGDEVPASFSDDIFAYTAANTIASKVLSLVGVDPIGIDVSVDLVTDDARIVAEAKPLCMYPVGDDKSIPGRSGHIARLSSDTSTVATFNTITSSLPTESQWGIIGMTEALYNDVVNDLEANSNGNWWLKKTQAHNVAISRLWTRSGLNSMTTDSAGNGMPSGQGTMMLAHVPTSVTFTKGSDTFTIPTGWDEGYLRGSTVGDLFGPGCIFSDHLEDGTLLSQGTSPYSYINLFTGAGDAQVSLVYNGDPSAPNSGLVSTNHFDHVSKLVPNMGPHDLALSLLGNLSPEQQRVLMTGNQSMTVEYDLGIFALGLPALFPSGQQDMASIAALEISCSPDQIANQVQTTFEPTQSYTLTWEERSKKVPDVLDINISFDRERIGSHILTRTADVTVIGESKMVKNQDNALWMQTGINDHTANGQGIIWDISGWKAMHTSSHPNGYWATLFSPMGGDVDAASMTEPVSTVHTLMAIAYNPRESPGGSWGKMNVALRTQGALQDIGSSWKMYDGLTTEVQNLGTQEEILNATLYPNYNEFIRAYSARYGYLQWDVNSRFARLGFKASASAVMPAYHSSSTVGVGYPCTFGPYSNQTLSGVHIGAQNVNSCTYMIPDDPDERMIYRPYRRIVDAAVAKELKQLLVPTHERYDGAGGPLGLPFYGTPTPFRFAQLAFDANDADQFILEPAASKVRMVDSRNRGMLTFGKVALLDTDTQRHELLPVLRSLNNSIYDREKVHASSITGTGVLTRDIIRDIQLGRQLQRMS